MMIMMMMLMKAFQRLVLLYQYLQVIMYFQL